PPLSHCDYSDWPPSFSIIPAVYMLAFLVGCLGNTLVLWVYLRRGGGRTTASLQRANDSDSSSPRPSHSLTDSLIGSLALADLCFLVTLPLWATYTSLGYHWPFGQPLCQLSSFLTALNMYASVFSLSLLSLERYQVLTGRRRCSHNLPHRRTTRALRVLGGLWLVAGILALPGLLLRSVREVELEEGGPGSVLSCQMDYSTLTGAELGEAEAERAEMWWAAALSLKSTLIGFLLPLVVLLSCYCTLARLLSRHFGHGPLPDHRRQRRLLRVIVTLVTVFFLCWLPLHLNKTVALLLEFDFLPYSCSLDQTLLALHPYVTCLAYLNSCLNPLLYAACDPSFRRRCRRALLLCCRANSRKAEGREGEEEEKEERSQEETAERTEEGEEEEEGTQTQMMLKMKQVHPLNVNPAKNQLENLNEL
ncbi:apelin receptor 2, partial [Austrofundulus limnaeus]|uniref:Apelin receptor 2 n=1 Tax=Austrofundulus limnaeus TaxID=52670 RepID=A0A2I4BWZ2_AUSLI